MADLLPLNSTAAESALEAAAARVSDAPVPVRAMWDADTCPAGLLPWLAWAFSVDEWNANWTEAQKRGAIARSMTVHRHKGTIGAVREALGGLGFTVSVQEWFSQAPAADPYTYTLILEPGEKGFGQNELGQVGGIVAGTKNLRSWLATIRPRVTGRRELFSAAVAGVGADITVKHEPALTYPDGSAALDLSMDAAVAGEPTTLDAIEQLHRTVHVLMPTI